MQTTRRIPVGRMRYWHVLLFIAACALMIFRPLHMVVVKGHSMMPTYPPGTALLVSRLVGNPVPGDVVVCRYEGEAIIKRVAYVAGDVVPVLRHRNVHVHDDLFIYPDTLFPDRFSFEDIRRHAKKMEQNGISYVVWLTIPEGHVYLVGDQISQSEDSRHFGPVKIETIEGIAL